MSVIATADANGTVLSAWYYSPFAHLLAGSSNGGFRFTGLDRDATGFDHAEMRQFTWVSGRWITPDPYDGSYTPEDPQSFNRYSYARNNPVAFTDPSGMSPICGVGANGEIAMFGNPTLGYVALGICVAEVVDHILDFFARPKFSGSMKPRPEAKEGTGTPNYDNPLSEHLGLPSWLHQQPGGFGGVGVLAHGGCEFGGCDNGFSGSYPNGHDPADKLWDTLGPEAMARVFFSSLWYTTKKVGPVLIPGGTSLKCSTVQEVNKYRPVVWAISLGGLAGGEAGQALSGYGTYVTIAGDTFCK